jgi:glucose 1-dehydrogenase
MRLQHKVAIVTGSASGIGKAIVAAFAREGAAVTIDYHQTPDEASAIVRRIESGGGRALAVHADVTQPDQVQRLIDQAVQKFGRLDILVNNAGTEQKAPFVAVSKELWDTVIAVDLTGPFLCAQAAARQMIKQGGPARIINISSVHEDLPMPLNAPYCAAKGGLRMLMRTIAVELAEHQITVNNIAPGAIDTPMDAPLKTEPALMKTLLAEIPLGRMGKPEEIAELAIYLASDTAAYVTGSTYFIDGGMIRQAGSL